MTEADLPSDSGDSSEPSDVVAAPDVLPVRRRRLLPALLAFGLPIAVALVAVVVLWGVEGGGGAAAPAVPLGKTYTYVIPKGTAEKMRNNQIVADILPEFVSLRVGDRMVVENQDDATHTFGPITVRAKELTKMDFVNPGLYYGICTVGTHDSITIQVT